ncbi:hypothetical protein Acsp03_70070 [Actinomadura sp. NBRC 104412]|uniref:hypothetical protein n=1 Tax=Actinomadura sp. NBRC 104412 TaxID=3032203 RepID=UPI0024A02CB5|nr:hypothetical protein [Actinomadura sp. NBRC 104412]GLZ09541.1 hypothetical protein Acsp03_70070 [Actinomadura sp. NBRC 104412]
MRIELAAAVFETDEHAEEVLTLLSLFRKGRHAWVVPPRLTATAASFIERHMTDLRAPVYKQLMRKAATLQHVYRAPTASKPVRISPEDVKEHVEDLGRPAVLVVENNRSDGMFVKAVAKIFGARDVLKALDDRWLVIEHGGGTDIYRRAQEEHVSFRRCSRAATLLDSDRLAPGTPEKNADRIAELRALGVRVHVLTLREAENYVPNKVLHAVKPIRNSSARLTHLKQLDHDQRGHFDMKHGFRKTSGVPEQQRRLFAGTPAKVITGLNDGFGQHILEVFESMADRLSEADLARDVGEDVPDELRGLLAMLREIL